MSAELETCMLQGIAWHHAGLTSEERAGVERAYCAGAIQVCWLHTNTCCLSITSADGFRAAAAFAGLQVLIDSSALVSVLQVVTATSTLAAGVNMPARRVILRSLHQARVLRIELCMATHTARQVRAACNLSVLPRHTTLHARPFPHAGHWTGLTLPVSADGGARRAGGPRSRWRVLPHWKG